MCNANDFSDTKRLDAIEDVSLQLVLASQVLEKLAAHGPDGKRLAEMADALLRYGCELGRISGGLE